MSIRSATLPSENLQPQQDAPGGAVPRIEPQSQIPSIYDTRSALGLSWCRVSLWRVLRYELCSFFGRMREARRTELYQRGISVLPEWVELLALDQYSAARLCCSKDRQKMAEKHNWMSLTDNLMFLQGWMLGATFPQRKSHSEESSPQQTVPPEHLQRQ